ncbi:hypothetical protein BDV19DRAFT_75842 [Aspergillus venezuelensis]
MYRPSSRNEWGVCGALLTQATLVIALEIYILVQWQLWVKPTITQVPVSYNIPIGLGILSFACIYQLILALDGTHQKNNILLFAICIANLCLVAYAAMQCTTMQDTTARLYADRFATPSLVDPSRNVWTRIQPAEILVPIILAITSLVLWPAVYFTHRDYSWVIYKSVHGSPKTRWRYMAYEVYLVLIKLDFFFLVAFIVQYGLIDVHFQEPEYSLTMAIIPAAFIVMVLGIYVVKNELVIGIVPIITCYIGLVVYFISRLIVLNGDGIRANTVGKQMMLLWAWISLALTLALLICSVVCLINFNHGLKNVKRGINREARGAYMLHSTPYATTDQWPAQHRYSSGRMSLD